MGLYAYGSGAIGEFWSAKVIGGARELMKSMGIETQLDARRDVSIEEYEKIELTRKDSIEVPEYTPDRSFPSGLWDSNYEGKGLLTLEKVENYIRTYAWS